MLGFCKWKYGEDGEVRFDDNGDGEEEGTVVVMICDDDEEE